MLRKLIKSVSLLLTAALLVCYLTGWSAVAVSPNVTSLPAYFGMAMPLFLLLMIVALVFWLWRKKFFVAAVLFGVLALSFPQWRRLAAVNFNAGKDIGETSVKIFTYNVGMFGGYRNFDEILDFIKEQDADIVCLQEFGFYERGMKQSELLRAFDSIYPYRHLWYKNQTRTSSYGLATFSRFPIVKKAKVQYASKYNVSIYSDVVIDGDTLRFINNHLESNKLSKRDREVTKMVTEDITGKEFAETSKGVRLKLSSAMRGRAHQAEAIRQEVDGSPYPVVVLGDFNDVPISYTYHRIAENLRDAYADAGRWGYYWTYNQNFMYFAIDHILFDERLKAVNCRIHKVDFSDHYPMTAVIRLR